MKTKPLNNLNSTMLKLPKTSRGLWLACATAVAFCLGQPVKAEISDGLVSYWPLDEIVGNKAPDLVSGYDLELANLSADDLIDGRVGRAFRFDNTRETLLYRVHRLGERLPINQHPALTISFWANVKGTGLTDLRMFSESSNRDNDPLFGIGTANNANNDTVDFYFRQSGWVDVNHLRTMGEPLDGTWHHLTFVQQEDGTRAFYIDGVEDGVVIPAKEPGDWRFNITTLGGILRADPSHWLTGAIDEVAVWSRPLTADEILALANAPLSSLLGAEAGFVLDPSSLTILEGQDFTLSVAVKGEPPITVQWYKGSEPIPSATHLTFPVINAMVADSGNYHAIAYNAFSIATSGVAVVEVQAGDFGPEVHFHETFETSQALDDWTWDAAWEIGEPTSGPGSAFNGTNCAATVLGGNYADNLDARLVSPALVVPAAVLNPRLRFWHWYSFYRELTFTPIDGGDYGRVQIRVNGGSWQNLSPIYADTSSGVWSRPSLDLSGYAGQSVELAFYLHTRLNSANSERTSSGWYVDEVELVTGPTRFPNPSGFESGLGDWWVDGGTWEVGMVESSPEGNGAAGTNLPGDYADNADARLVSPGFVVPAAVLNPRLRFWHWYSFYRELTFTPIDGGDYGRVQIRVNGGSWQNLSPIYADTSSGVWSRPSLDLSGYAGQSVELAFYLHTRLNSANSERTSSGWYVDEVRLLHDSALALTESVVMRSQETACIPISIAASSPASTVSFTLHAPADNLSDLALDMDGCWAASTIVPQGESEWQVTLQNECAETHMGLQDVGRLCFKAVSAQSAFVPLTIRELSVTYQEGSLTTPIYSWGNRAVVIANEPLLEAWQTTNGEQMVTLFGKPFTTYDIRQSTAMDTPRPWGVGWTETVPFGLFLGGPVQGELSSAPILFLDATEQ